MKTLPPAAQTPSPIAYTKCSCGATLIRGQKDCEVCAREKLNFGVQDKSGKSQ